MVSIIIPVYNVEAFLDDAIQSVLDQSFKDIEVILVNDGSTDSSATICHKYAQMDSRVKFFNQKNAGVSAARNKGLLHANGEYVFFMDSDDSLDRDHIMSSYNIAKKENLDILVIGSLYVSRLPQPQSLPTWALMLRMNFLRQHTDVRFPVNIQPCEDGLFSHQLIALTTKLGGNPKDVYHYRQHPNQNHVKIKESTEKVVQQIPIWLDILEGFYTRHHLFESHAKHLALFIEHEPFEIRYVDMPLNNKQKVFLHTIVKKFMLKNVLPYLGKTDRKFLTKPFLHFVAADNPVDFDNYYSGYMKLRKQQSSFYMSLTKLVFIQSVKQRLRKKIREKFRR
ncbi:glycosyltransferase family 2 protein [Niabella aquatica]